MTTQTFRGTTLEEARRAARTALGEEAVVVATRSTRRAGLAGLFGGREVEIAAELPEPPPSSSPAQRLAPFAAGAYLAPEASRDRESAPDLAALRAELRNEIRSMKERIGKTPVPAASSSVDLAAEVAAMRETIAQLAPKPKRGDKTAALLAARGIEGAAAAAITRALRDGNAEVPLDERLREAIADTARVAAWPLAGERALIALIGTSGVGKTTTIAKLAARAVMEDRTVTLISCDGFRVGAEGQLARYAELMGVRFERASTANELAAVIKEAKTDYVFVDTSGREPTGDEPATLFMRKTIEQAIERPMHVLLCTPASLRTSDAARTAKKFAPCSPTAIVVTKIDETDAPSGLLHAPVAARIPVSVLCFGQRVPEDVAPATTGAIVDHVAPRAPSPPSRKKS